MFSEGTKELRPTEADNGSIQILAQNGSNSTFAMYKGAVDQRLNVRICNVGEQVYFGFGQNGNLVLRVYDPKNNLIAGPMALNNGAGIINTYNQAVAGPSAIVGATGYNALSFTTTSAGDYYFEFETINTAVNTRIDLLDITVRNLQGNITPGRLWSSAWQLNTNNYDNPFNAEMFIYTRDRIVTKIDFNGIQPYEFVISANSTGTSKTGNVIQDRKSTYKNNTYPEFKIFLNEPDIQCFPTGSLGEIVGTPSITGCPGNYCINVNVSVPGEMIFNLEGNGIPGFQANSEDLSIQASLSPGGSCIQWDGKDGKGNPIANATSIKMSIQFVNGLTNLPIFDVENHPNGYHVTYVRPKPSSTGNDITLFWDDSNITGGTSIDQKVNSVSGCSLPSGCHRWSNRGNDNGCNYTCPETINTWWYVKESNADIVYNGDLKNIDANKNTPGTGSANDTSACASIKEILLNGSLVGEKHAKWSIIPGFGTGKFLNDTLLSTKYILSAADAKLGSVRLVLSSDKSNCAAIHDTIKIFLEPLPTLQLTAPTSICLNSPTLSASLTSNSGIISWSGSGGKFAPDSLSKTIQYTPSQKELDSNTVWLKAKTLAKPNQLCATTKDSVKISVYQPPSLKAPSDTLLCQSKQVINLKLNAIAEQADSVVWSNNAGITHSPRRGLTSTLAINQKPAFKVFLKAYKKGCNAISDTTEVKFETPASVAATASPTCHPNLIVNLTGNITGGISKGKWSSSGTGLFFKITDSTKLNSYIPSKADSAAGTINLTLSSGSQIVCPIKDTLIVWKIIPLPIANAGNDTTICIVNSLTRETKLNPDWTYEWKTNKNGAIKSTNSKISLNVSQDSALHLNVKNIIGCVATDSSKILTEKPPKISAIATPTCDADLRVILNGIETQNNGTWKSSGTGTFASNANILINNAYVPSKSDSAIGIVKLTLTSESQLICPAKDTSIIWKIIPLPVADAGNDSIACVNTVIRRKTISNSEWKYEWRSAKNTAPISTTASYSFSTSNPDNKIYLTVINSRSCTVNDSALVSTITPPQISLPNQICLYKDSIITALVSNAPTLGSYSWKRQDTLLNISSPSLLIDAPATYKYEYDFKGGCKSSDSLIARMPPKLLVKDTSACQNGNTVLTANNITNAKYYWGTSKILGVNTFPVNAGNGISNYEVLVVDAFGCRDSTKANILIFPYPDFSLSAPDICPGETNTMVANLNQPSLIVSYPDMSAVWERNGLKITTQTWNSVTYNQEGNYTLTLGIKGCFITKSKSVSKKPNPEIKIPTVHKYCFETDPPLSLQSNTFAKYVWRNDEGLIDTISSILVTPEKDTYYYLDVENEFGCKDSAKILVRKVCKPRLFVPNVITPLSNDINAALQIFGAHYTNFEITVFSRWGEVIFNSKDPKNTWNGKYKDEQMPIGNFQWQVTYEGDTEEYKGPYKKTGDVAVIR